MKVRFVSVKWKVMAVTSVLLFVLTSVYIIVDQHNRARDYEAARESRRVLNQLVVRQTLERSKEDLLRLAAVLAGLPAVRGAIADEDGAAIRTVFTDYFDSLQLSAGVVSGIFYSGETLLVAFSEPGSKRNLDGIAAVARTVRASETPDAFLDCEEVCRIFAVVPVLGTQHAIGTVVLGATVEELVLGFKRAAGGDLGILARIGQDGPSSHATALGMRLIALSDAKARLPVLQQADGKWTTGSHRVLYREFGYGDRRYEVARWAANSRGSTATEFVVLSDVTAAHAEIAAARGQALAVGGAGLAVAEVVLLGLLAGPMGRVRRMAENMPLIGRGEYDTVRRHLAVSRREGVVQDELDLLDHTALELAKTLEDLSAESEAQRGELARLVTELSHEKDFVTGLLDTAQVLIVTHGRDGRVAMVNGFTLALTGFGYSELRGQDFVDAFYRPEERQSTRGALAEMSVDEPAVFRVESPLKCKDGSLRRIVWFHSRLSGAGTQTPTILSVGLDITDLRRAEETVQQLSDFDTLTGLMNRHSFGDAVTRILGAEGGASGALFVLDLDEFKTFNEAAGHEAGDALLNTVGSWLRNLPGVALAARLGGDDFACVVHGSDAPAAMQFARSLTGIPGVPVPDSPVRSVSASVGIALFPEHGTTFRELLSAADLALFHAKRKGRASWHMYATDDRLLERAVARLFWVDRIEQALADDRFELHFQPVMRIADGRVTHYEALIRMRGPDNVLIPPGEFIPVAEATGLIRAVDRWVVTRAVQTLAAWQRDGVDADLAINVSGRSFGDPSLPETLRAALARHAVDPSRLIIEITETATLEDLGAARSLIESLSDLGCRFALDDFGVGFASFQYLKELPVHYVKIDGSFVRRLDERHDDQVFVRALVASAQAFGKETVAEFVETGGTLRLLREMGVGYAQGYFIGRPGPEILREPSRIAAVPSQASLA